MVQAAVIGHVEWVEFARVPHVPAAGEIVHADRVWAEPADAPHGKAHSEILESSPGDEVLLVLP